MKITGISKKESGKCVSWISKGVTSVGKFCFFYVEKLKMMGRNSLIKSIFRAKRFCFYINKYYFCTRIESEGAEKVKKIEEKQSDALPHCAEQRGYLIDSSASRKNPFKQ